LEYFLFSPIVGMMIQSDIWLSYFQGGIYIYHQPDGFCWKMLFSDDLEDDLERSRHVGHLHLEWFFAKWFQKWYPWHSGKRCEKIFGESSRLSRINHRISRISLSLFGPGRGPLKGANAGCFCWSSILIDRECWWLQFWTAGLVSPSHSSRKWCSTSIPCLFGTYRNFKDFWGFHPRLGTTTFW
jgi:hypothetical protein